MPVADFAASAPGNTESQVKRSGRRPGAGRPRTYRDRQGKPVHLRPVEKERCNRPAHAAYSESYFGQKKRDLRFNRDINRTTLYMKHMAHFVVIFVGLAARRGYRPLVTQKTTP